MQALSETVSKALDCSGGEEASKTTKFVKIINYQMWKNPHLYSYSILG